MGVASSNLSSPDPVDDDGKKTKEPSFTEIDSDLSWAQKYLKHPVTLYLTKDSVPTSSDVATNKTKMSADWRIFNDEFSIPTTKESKIKDGQDKQDGYSYPVFNERFGEVTGVFDGHGENTEVKDALVDFFKYSLPKKFKDNPDGNPVLLLWESFQEAKEHLDKKVKSRDLYNAGSTATVVLSREQEIYTAWVGDSSAYMFVYPGKMINLTPKLHSADNLDEYMRIKNSGVKESQPKFEYPEDEEEYLKDPTQKKYQPRFGGLNMTRSFGDYDGGEAIISEPYISKVVLDESDIDKPRFIIVGTDGLWDEVRPHEILPLLFVVPHRTNERMLNPLYDKRFYPYHRIEDVGLAAAICSLAIDKGEYFNDDTTCVVLSYYNGSMQDHKDKIVRLNTKYRRREIEKQLGRALLHGKGFLANEFDVQLKMLGDSEEKKLRIYNRLKKQLSLDDDELFRTYFWREFVNPARESLIRVGREFHHQVKRDKIILFFLSIIIESNDSSYTEDKPTRSMELTAKRKHDINDYLKTAFEKGMNLVKNAFKDILKEIPEDVQKTWNTDREISNTVDDIMTDEFLSAEYRASRISKAAYDIQFALESLEDVKDDAIKLGRMQEEKLKLETEKKTEEKDYKELLEDIQSYEKRVKEGELLVKELDKNFKEFPNIRKHLDQLGPNASLKERIKILELIQYTDIDHVYIAKYENVYSLESIKNWIKDPEMHHVYQLDFLKKRLEEIKEESKAK